MLSERALHIAVCDDRREDMENIILLISQIMQEADITYDIEEYSAGKDLLAAIDGGKQFGILLLDVMMEELDGISLAVELRKQENKTQIIFISINREMALFGYEVSAARYLAKPVDREKLREALLYCNERLSVKKEILLPTDKGKHRISFEDIQYVEAFDRGTRVFSDEGSFETRLKFCEISEMLPRSDFLICHRAFIVNIGHVKLIRPYEFLLKSGATVPIGKGRYVDVRNKFVDFITN